MPWYEGPSLLHHLEEVHIASDRNLIDARFPVQYVIRPQAQGDHDLHDYRGYAGTVAGGVFKPGDEVVVLPSGFTSTVASIDTADGPVDEAFAPMSVTIRLADDIDVSRGDMICRARNQPHVGQDIDAMVCWMTRRASLRTGAKLAIKHTTRWGRAWSRTSSTGSTSTRCTATRPRPSWRSTRSAGCSCAPRCRCSSTSTAATARPAASSSSTRRRNNTVGAGMILGPTEVA